jgi:hypothetical protein
LDRNLKYQRAHRAAKSHQSSPYRKQYLRLLETVGECKEILRIGQCTTRLGIALVVVPEATSYILRRLHLRLHLRLYHRLHPRLHLRLHCITTPTSESITLPSTGLDRSRCTRRRRFRSSALILFPRCPRPCLRPVHTFVLCTHIYVLAMPFHSFGYPPGIACTVRLLSIVHVPI